MHKPQKVNVQVPVQVDTTPTPELPKKVIGELKEANLQKLKDGYKQPFSLPQKVDEAEQFSQAPTDKPIRQGSLNAPSEGRGRQGVEVPVA